MQLSLNKLRHGAILVGILLCSALPGHAQFGGVVFDPTQSVHALQQIQQNIQNSVTWQQQLANEIQMAATLDKDYMQAVTTYNTIYGNLKNFSSKSIWRTVQSQLTMASFANQYGETTGLQSAMNGQAPGTASMVWKLMNLGLNSTSSSFLSSQVPQAHLGLLSNSGFVHDLMLTSYGSHQLRTSFTGLHLDQVFTAGFAGGPNTQKFSTMTVNGSLGITHVAHHPFPKMLQTAKGILTAALATSS